MPGDLFDDVKAGASKAADEVRAAFVVKTVLALAVLYVLATPRRRRWR